MLDATMTVHIYSWKIYGQAALGGVSRISHGHTGEHETRFDVTQGKRFEKLGRRCVDEILMSF